MWEQEKLETKKLLAACAVKSYKNNVIMPQESKSAFHFWKALLLNAITPASPA
jgi:hypothetical protein